MEIKKLFGVNRYGVFKIKEPFEVFFCVIVANDVVLFVEKDLKKKNEKLNRIAFYSPNSLLSSL